MITGFAHAIEITQTLNYSLDVICAQMCRWTRDAHGVHELVAKRYVQ